MEKLVTLAPMQKFSLIFEKNIFWGILLLLIFIPLYPKIPSFNVGGTYVAIRAEDFLIAMVAFAWVLGHLFKFKKYLTQTIFQSFLLFWVIGGLSLLSALLISFFVSPHLGFLHWIRRIEYMSLFLIAATSITSIKQVKFALWAVLISALVVIIYGFGQIWLDFPVISTTNKEFSKGLILTLANGARVNSTFAGHYDLAIYLSVILAMVCSMFFYFKNWAVKFILIFIGSLGFILLGLTAARVSFLAALFGIALIFWLAKKKILLIGLALVAMVVLAAIPDLRHRLVATVTVNLMGGGGPKYNPPSGTVTKFTPQKARGQSTPVQSSAKDSGAIAVDTVPGEPINTTELGVFRSYGIRFNVEWPRAVNAFYKNPLLGTGYSSLTIATDNDYLRSLGETGLLGTLSFGLIFFIILKKIFSSFTNAVAFVKFYNIGVLSITVIILMTATFIDVFEASKAAEVFWLILGIGWGLASIPKTHAEEVKK